MPQLGESRGLDQSPYHHQDVLGHTLEVVEHTADLVADPEPVFRSQRRPRARGRSPRRWPTTSPAARPWGFPALLHDMAKPATRAVTPEGRVTFIGHDRLGAEMADDFMRRLRTSTRLREFVDRCVRMHLPLGFMVHRTPLSLRQIDRYLRATAPWEVEIIVLSVADRLATRGPRTSESAIRRHLALAREVMDAHFALVNRGPVRPLLTGDEAAAELGPPAGALAVASCSTSCARSRWSGAVRTERRRPAASPGRWGAAHPS